MKSVMKHDFSKVPNVEIQRSRFDRSHGHKTTFDAGYLIPVLVDEVLPGDTFNVNMSAIARLSTPIYPVMDNIYLDTHFFAVPLRLVWSNFKKFMGEQANPGDSIDYLVPTIDSGTGGHPVGSIYDYMGIPTDVDDLVHSALFLRAYNLIWNEWYRDENIQNSVTVATGDGPDAKTNYTLLKRGKRHDYFTSALPWPQKGDSVELPLGSDAPVLGIGVTTPYTDTSVAVKETYGASTTFDYATGADNLDKVYVETNAAGYPLVRADLTQATAATINSLRQAFQIQKLLEKDARGGTRYTELVKSHFGVTSPDARMQRPEYLGGGSTPVTISPIAATAGTGTLAIYPGDLGAMGTAVVNRLGFTKSFTEHCIIIGLVSARADLTYQQGLNRMWSRQTRYDFYWPSLAQIGEQTVLNKEIYAVGSATPGQDDAIFGYQERYAEYRYKPSIITGQFRSTYITPLDSWHLSQEFTSLPQLNSAFIEETPPIDRVVRVTSEPDFIFDSYFNMNCVRPMPMFGVPGMIDHF